MAKYINPFTDWGFKRLFGQEFSKDLLISFLNDLLEGELRVKDVTFMDKEQLPLTKDQRGIIYDVYCETDTGKRFILEMQNRWQPNFLDRTVCYASRCIVDQIEKSKKEREGAYQFLPIYTVCFMNFTPPEEEISKFRTDVVLADKDSKEQISDKLRFIYLALPYFKKKAEECDSDFDKWIYVLKHMEALTRMPWTAQKNIFKQLEEYADSHHLTKKEWEAYENSLWIARDNMAAMAYAERVAAEKARADGKAEGIAIGQKKEHERLLNTARALLASGMSLEQVKQFTGLNDDEIKQIPS